MAEILKYAPFLLKAINKEILDHKILYNPERFLTKKFLNLKS